MRLRTNSLHVLLHGRLFSHVVILPHRGALRKVLDEDRQDSRGNQHEHHDDAETDVLLPNGGHEIDVPWRTAWRPGCDRVQQCTMNTTSDI